MNTITDFDKSIMENNNQHKRYRWYLQFDEITWPGAYYNECPPFVNEENKEAWRRYLNKVSRCISKRRR